MPFARRHILYLTTSIINTSYIMTATVGRFQATASDWPPRIGSLPYLNLGLSLFQASPCNWAPTSTWLLPRYLFIVKSLTSSGFGFSDTISSAAGHQSLRLLIILSFITCLPCPFRCEVWDHCSSSHVSFTPRSVIQESKPVFSITFRLSSPISFQAWWCSCRGRWELWDPTWNSRISSIISQESPL